MITKATGLRMDGIRFYKDQKLLDAVVKKFPKDEVEKVKLVKGSHTYYSPKKTTVQHAISEVSKSEEDLGDEDDEDDEGYDTKVDVEVDPHITVLRKRKRKTGQEEHGKGFIIQKQKREDDDSWYKEEEESEDDMEIDSEEVQIISSQKKKAKMLRGEELGAKNCSPLPTKSKDHSMGLAEENSPNKEIKIT
ncbi:uncharacterized protein LOC131059774 [Cryptomeria japonica]|uniref:uncharacterized protein LOC131059774 n=1 Tax=Cryptomeria japonica TaxID=3369 RepID=UPI0027DAA257|nr:uncharacterized protein LOC131059774 [Cryptomeria japonica]